MFYQRCLLPVCIILLMLTSACFENNKTGKIVDPQAPQLAEVTPAGIVYDDAPPTYTFSSSAAGSITYGGSCLSSTTTAVHGNNTVIFNVPDWNLLYSDCTITVTDAQGRSSAPLAVSPFRQIRRGSLNDTGLDGCADDSSNHTGDDAAKAAGCNALAGTYPGQDAVHGRDANPAQNDNADGYKGFSFSKLDNNGDESPADADDWPCVRDNTTGLIWTKATVTGKTQAEALAQAATTSVCGISSWQVPSRRELLSIVHYGQQPAIDSDYFPATVNGRYWSRDTYVAAANHGWSVDFSDGSSLGNAVSTTQAVRLVYRPANRALHNIDVPRDEAPGERRYPGWASGIVPGATDGSYSVNVQLLPVTDQQALEFDVPPAIDPVTGTLSFTIKNKTGVLGTSLVAWSSAGLARVEVRVQDGSGVDGAVHSFEIFANPVPAAKHINVKHPWKAACIPITMTGWDLDSDQLSRVLFPNTPFLAAQIITYPSKGFIQDYVARPAPGAIVASRDDGDEPADNWKDGWVMGLMANSHGYHSFGLTRCYVPFSSTFVGSDTFTYTVIDIDGNESAPASVSIEIFEK